MIAIGIKGSLGPLHRSMIALGAKQVPFAMSLALNTLAKGVAADQVKLIDETFSTPTPFTERAYRIQVATKASQIAVVAAKDIQAQYLEPYVVGGRRSLGSKRGMLAPRGPQAAHPVQGRHRGAQAPALRTARACLSRPVRSPGIHRGAPTSHRNRTEVIVHIRGPRRASHPSRSRRYQKMQGWP